MGAECDGTGWPTRCRRDAVLWWRQTEEDNRRRKKSLKLMLQRSAVLHVVPMFLFSCFCHCGGEATDLGTEGTFFTCGEEL